MRFIKLTTSHGRYYTSVNASMITRVTRLEDANWTNVNLVGTVAPLEVLETPDSIMELINGETGKEAGGET